MPASIINVDIGKSFSQEAQRIRGSLILLPSGEAQGIKIRQPTID